MATELQNRTISHQRAMMAFLGVPLWTQRHTPTTDRVAVLFDRFLASGDELPLQDNANQQSVQIKHTKQQNQSDKDVFAVAKQTPNLNDDASNVALDLPSLSKKSSSSFAKDGVIDTQSRDLSADNTANISAGNYTIKFNVEGVRVGQWVLIVDVGQADRAEQSIWASLKTALSAWAEHSKVNFAEHQLHYPLSADDINTPALAQKCLDGFVMRLQLAGEFAQQVAFLTTLSDGVDYFGETTDLPSLTQMHQNPQSKKQLWQRVVG